MPRHINALTTFCNINLTSVLKGKCEGVEGPQSHASSGFRGIQAIILFFVVVFLKIEFIKMVASQQRSVALSQRRNIATSGRGPRSVARSCADALRVEIEERRSRDAGRWTSVRRRASRRGAAKSRCAARRAALPGWWVGFDQRRATMLRSSCGV